MKVYNTRSVMLALCAILLSAAASAEPQKKIAVDVGHSLAIPGATSARGVGEFTFNKNLATRIGAALHEKGLPYFYIGLDGLAENVRVRPPLAKKNGTAFLLSVHHDSVQPHYLQDWQDGDNVKKHYDGFSGFSLFVSKGNKYGDISLQCAQAIGAALIASGMTPTQHHAEDIAGERRIWADKKNGVYYYDTLHVLNATNAPAVLLEAGIIVNKNDEQALQSSKVQNQIASAVASGIVACQEKLP